MSRFLTHTLAAVLASTFALGSIGAIVSAPPAQTAGPATLILPQLA